MHILGANIAVLRPRILTFWEGTKLLISPVKILPKNDQIWHFCQALPAHLVPCWLVGGCGARVVSRKTPIYFILM